MFVGILRPEWILPNATNTVLLDFKIVPRPGESWRLLNSISKWGGRFVNKGSSVTNLTTQTCPAPGFGTANHGLEVGGGLDLTNTTPQYGSTTPLYPYNRIRVSGTIANGDTNARLMLLIGAPVDDIIVTYARDGMPVKEGDSLLDSARHGNELVW